MCKELSLTVLTGVLFSAYPTRRRPAKSVFDAFRDFQAEASKCRKKIEVRWGPCGDGVPDMFTEAKETLLEKAHTCSSFL